MKRYKIGALEWLTFDLFEEFHKIKHGIFLRHGGVSEGAFFSLNFSSFQGDAPEKVEKNWILAQSALGLQTCCKINQEHGNKVIIAQPGHRDVGDALTTNRDSLALAITHADCQAAIFYDPIHHAIANVHSGWRGSVKNIYRETVHAMKALYGSSPQDLYVGVSPSLGPEAAEFIHYQTELPHSFYPFQSRPTYFNFWEISRAQLEQCHILPHHIEIAQMCTYSNPEDFFSYRREKSSGRHATFISLTNQA